MFVGIEVTAKLERVKIKERLGSIATVVGFVIAELVMEVGTMTVEN